MSSGVIITIDAWGNKQIQGYATFPYFPQQFRWDAVDLKNNRWGIDIYGNMWWFDSAWQRWNIVGVAYNY